MSTLKSVTVVHPSSATNNIVNDASGNVAIGNNLTVAGTATIAGVAAVAVAPSTAGNVLTSTGSAWASTAPAFTASLTLLATLTTTSGTTQSATGLATTYTNLVCVYEAVTNSTGSDTLTMAASSNNGSNYGTAQNTSVTSPVYGIQQIWRANSNSINHPAPFYSQQANSLAYLTTTTAAPINALRFSWSSGYTFSGGTIYIYGWN